MTRAEQTVQILLEENGVIKTEAQLCYYMYKKFGSGRFSCLGFKKGIRGFWLFWLGNLYENGFIRDKNKNVELEKLKEEFTKAKTYEEKEDIEEEMSFEKDIHQIEKSIKRRGPIGIIKSPVGVLNEYQKI